MKLYIDIDYKEKYEIAGNVYNKPGKCGEEIFLLYKASVFSGNIWTLNVRKVGSLKEFNTALDSTLHGKPTAKNILYYIEQKIDFFKNL